MAIFKFYNSKNDTIAIKSVEKITDQAKLLAIINEATNPNAISACIKNIRDHQTLKQIVLTHKYFQNRYSAIFRINDQTILSEIAILSLDKDLRRYAVEHIRDNNLLKHIVINSQDSQTIANAIARISTQAIFEELLQRNDERLTERVFPKITNQVIIKQYALEHPYKQIRSIAIKKLVDMPTLINVAYNDPDMYNRIEAATKITDINTLKDLVIKNKIKIYAINVTKINDQDFLLMIAKTSGNYTFKEILKKLTNTNLTKLLSNELDNFNTNEVLREITNRQDFDLITLGKTSKLEAVHNYVIRNLQNQQAIYDLAMVTTYQQIRKIAIERLEDQTMLFNLAKDSDDRGELFNVCCKLTSSDLIKKILSGYLNKPVEDFSYFLHNIVIKIKDDQYLWLWINHLDNIIDKMSVYKFLSVNDDGLIKLFDSIFNGNNKTSEATHANKLTTINRLLDYLSSNPKLGKSFYQSFALALSAPHSDTSYNHANCGHDDWHSDTGSGIPGVVVPPYPFED